eukprot:CAMPEP_0197615524 /NCGR_PEP_ID=MMETSP1326-20131121/60072_1 /TAXON_ID=1155430 /ORGANISM="Genus nov. species nov., Strain RCC2288" /LENGTH=140 /DNA_ID=CAMNT_0043184405 /DNA_START=452 /DNA_END=874 /DNA_ORIENTATION=-
MMMMQPTPSAVNSLGFHNTITCAALPWPPAPAFLSQTTCIALLASNTLRLPDSRARATALLVAGRLCGARRLCKEQMRARRRCEEEVRGEEERDDEHGRERRERKERREREEIRGSGGRGGRGRGGSGGEYYTSRLVARG